MGFHLYRIRDSMDKIWAKMCHSSGRSWSIELFFIVHRLSVVGGTGKECDWCGLELICVVINGVCDNLNYL